jgi:hypothetical protein
LEIRPRNQKERHEAEYAPDQLPEPVEIVETLVHPDLGTAKFKNADPADQEHRPEKPPIEISQ